VAVSVPVLTLGAAHVEGGTIGHVRLSGCCGESPWWRSTILEGRLDKQFTPQHPHTSPPDHRRALLNSLSVLLLPDATATMNGDSARAGRFWSDLSNVIPAQPVLSSFPPVVAVHFERVQQILREPEGLEELKPFALVPFTSKICPWSKRPELL
jgi:hypothetical protein